MLFLMNDTVLNLGANTGERVDTARFRALGLSFLVRLGQELFAEAPRLQRTDAERARRLAVLIAARQPEVNAALFVAPGEACASDEVMVHFRTVAPEVMGRLQTRQAEGALTPVAADREVWRRLAA